MQKLSLTPNRRMAAFLKQRYPDRRVMALDTWCDALYLALVEHNPQTPRCLSLHESRVLWEQIVRASPIGQEILDVSSMASLAYEAFRLCIQWRLQKAPLEHSQNSRLYQVWSLEYQTFLQEKHCVDSTTKLDSLIDAIKQHPEVFSLPQQMDWIGFQEIIPQYADLIIALEKAGIQIQKSVLDPKQGEAYCVVVPDPIQGLRIAAFDAKQWLASFQGKQPSLGIGIVIPDLAQQRDRVVSVFSRVLPNGSFKISGPPPLIRYPVIATALCALSLAQGQITIETISRLLRSPFFGESDLNTMQERATFEVYLRTLNEPNFSWEQLGSLAQVFDPSNTDNQGFRWWFSIEDCIAHKHDLENKTHKKASEWSLWMQQWLKILGWPGTRGLDATETALIRAFEELLKNYAALDNALALHAYEKAYAECKTIAASMLFLPSDIDEQAPIQVLGVLEAAGLHFDKLWVLGMNDSQWPTSPEPNPFIPLYLQRQYGLPRSSVEREYQVAQALTQAFCQSANTVIFAYAQMIDDRVGQKSTLLKALPERGLSSLSISSVLLDQVPSYLQSIAAYQPFDLSLTEQGPAISLPRVVKGGGRALQLQSLCPFRAFAETRLGAKPLKSCSVGLSAAERGILMHKALEYFWRSIKTQKQLLKLSDTALREHLKRAIDRACKKVAIGHRLEGLYKILEEARLLERLYRFMMHEKNRPDFQVLALEASSMLDYQGLQFKVRMDRIDRVEGLGEVLIDYKSGKTSISDWFGPRPRDLQLPLYAVGRATAPAALAFAGLHAHQIGFKGVAKEAIAWPGIKAMDGLGAAMLAEKNWTEQIESWKKSVEALALEFSSGIAKVDPLEGAKTCRHCALKTLCRVQHT